MWDDVGGCGWEDVDGRGFRWCSITFLYYSIMGVVVPGVWFWSGSGVQGVVADCVRGVF